MRRSLAVLVLLTAACSNERPLPDAARDSTAPAPAAPATTTTTTTTQTSATTSAASPAATAATYQQAMDWLRSSSGFHFELTENGVRAEGDMARPMVGAERVHFRAEGVEWLALAKPTGVIWHRRNGNSWQKAAAPGYGDRIYQRVTIAFDPQKKEGEAQLAGGDATTTLYRFTNANTGELHEVWVAKADGRIERMKIGNAVEMRFGALSGDVPKG